MNLIATWSGGKDSCFATFKAIKLGHSIKFIANSISDDFRRVRFHGVKAELIQAQSEAIGIPLLQQETSASDYRKDFLVNIKKGLESSVEGLVFGDIFLPDCYQWAEEICNELKVKLLEPLWKKPSLEILTEFIAEGFEAIIVSVQADKLDSSWVGRRVDKSFIKDIKKLKNVDPCGENGEFHSLVLNGPIFKKRISVDKSKKILIKGFWFLDIQKYSLVDKN